MLMCLQYTEGNEMSCFTFQTFYSEHAFVTVAQQYLMISTIPLKHRSSQILTFNASIS